MVLPNSVVQELRNLMALNVREFIMGNHADGLQKEGQEELAYKVFHGTESYGSVLDSMIEGKGFYSKLFIEHELENLRENNEFRTSGTMMELDPMLHLDKNAKYILHDPGFTKEDLRMMKGTKKNAARVPLSARVIVERGLLVLANYRVALKYHDEYMQGVAKGEYPSGKKLEDMLLYVRQKVFCHFQGARYAAATKKKKKKESSPDGGESTTTGGKPKLMTEEDMPSDYFFYGWFAFVLLGPQGRAAIRKEEATRRDKEREANVGGTGVYKRGTSTTAAAGIELAERNTANMYLKDTTRNVRELLSIANNDHQTCLNHLKDLEQMIDNAMKRGSAMPSGAVDVLLQQQGEIFEELKEISKRKKYLQQQSNLLIADSLEMRPAFTSGRATANKSVSTPSTRTMTTVPPVITLNNYHQSTPTPTIATLPPLVVPVVRAPHHPTVDLTQSPAARSSTTGSLVIAGGNTTAAPNPSQDLSFACPQPLALGQPSQLTQIDREEEDVPAKKKKRKRTVKDLMEEHGIRRGGAGPTAETAADYYGGEESTSATSFGSDVEEEGV